MASFAGAVRPIWVDVEGGPDPQALLDALPDVVVVIDDSGVLRYVNAAASIVLGLDPVDWIGRSVVDLVHEDDVAVVLSSIVTVQGKESGTPIEVRVRAAGDTWRWLEVIGRDRLDEPHVNGLVCVARDLTRRRMWEVAGNDLACFQQVVQHASSITLLLDEDGVVRSVNGAFTRLLNHDPSVVVGRPLSSFAGAGAEPVLDQALACCRETGHRVTAEVWMRADRDAPARPVRFELVNLLHDPVVAGIVVTGHDVSDLHEARQALEDGARRDMLTGLANRRALIERLEALLAQEQPFAVLYVDLDRFKAVNDLLGHDTGDELLEAVARRLQACVRSGDLVARLGGDEFVVVAPGVHDEAVAAGLVDAIDRSLIDEFDLRAGPVHIGASVGMAIAQAGATVAGLLVDSDLAMYDTKAARRGTEERPMVERRRSSDERRRLVDELELGLDRGEIIAHLQPIVDVASGRTVAMEALARWEHPERGLLWPASFLQLAETTGLSLPLADAVVDSACSSLGHAGLLAAGVDLCVNFSSVQLADPQLASRIDAILARHELSMDRLVVEVAAEAALVRQPRPGWVTPEETIRRFHGMGAALSIDSVGIGQAAFAQLRTYPISVFKIDGTLVSGLLRSAQNRAIVAALVGVADALGLHAVGEGVESEEQLEVLVAMGVERAQGFHIAGPMSPSELAAWCSDRRRCLAGGAA